MRLRRLNIQNYRAIRNLELSFLDGAGHVGPVAVIAGRNGSGKSSILFSIVQALRGVMGYRTDEVPEPNPLDIHGSGPLVQGWRDLPGKKISVELEIEFAAEEREAIRKVCSASNVPLRDLPQDRLTLRWVYPPKTNPDGEERPWWFFETIEPLEKGVPAWLKARMYAIQAWKQRRIDMETLLKIGGLYFFPQDRALQKRVLGNGYPASMEEEVPAPRPGPAGYEVDEPIRKADLPAAAILRYMTEQALLQPNLPADRKWEERVKELFNRICAPKRYLGFKVHDELLPMGAPCFDDAGNIYPLQNAASGEQVVIEYCARLNHPQPRNHHLILIDEPEIHLHAEWIRRFYYALPEIGRGNQFILTTQSAELRERAAADKVLFELDRDTHDSSSR